MKNVPNKNSTNTKDKKNKLLYTREELLGNTEFTLGDSEIVVKYNLDFILKLVMNKIRLNYVESLMNVFVLEKTFNLFRNLVNCEFNIRKVDLELDFNKDKLEIHLTKPKIDAMVTNKTRIIPKPQETNIIPESNNSNNTSFNSVKSQPKTSVRAYKNILPAIAKVFSKKKTENKPDNISKEEKELRSGLIPLMNKSSSSFLSNLQSPITKALFAGIQSAERTAKQETRTYKFRSNLSPAVKKEESFQYEQMSMEKDLDTEQEDELELAKERNFRAYFQMKEERETKLKNQKNLEEKTRDEERKRRKLLEEDNKKPFIYDFEGKLVNVKNVDLNKLVKPPQINTQVKECEDNLPRKSNIEISPKFKRMRSKISSAKNNYDPKVEEKLKKKQKEKNNEKMKEVIIVENEDGDAILSPQPKFYQPDPLVSHNVPPGVTMQSYGITKLGGHFPKVENKLSKSEFQVLLQKYKPPTINPLATEKLREEEKLLESAQMNTEQRQTFKLSRVLDLDLKDTSEDKEIFKYLNKDFKPVVFSKYQKKENGEFVNKEEVDKVKVMGEFKLKEYNPVESNKLMDVFNIYEEEGNERVILQRNKSPVVPKNLHGNEEKELGLLKKYPRERISKEIMGDRNKFAIKIDKKELEKNEKKGGNKLNSKK